MVCLCSSLFFLGLYQFNNKYSQDTIQAANGILALSEEELQKSPVRFLVSGWAFYPDALLTPEEIRDESHYMRYLSIGAQTNFSSPANPSPYGCGISSAYASCRNGRKRMHWKSRKCFLLTTFIWIMT